MFSLIDVAIPFTTDQLGEDKLRIDGSESEAQPDAELWRHRLG
jgi:hypothetical protein